MTFEQIKRKISFWLLRNTLSEDERRMLYGMRLGFDSMQPKETERIVHSFELDDRSHDFLHSADGVRKYDAKRGAARQLLRAREDDLAELIQYVETKDETTGIWKCTSWLEVVRR